MILDSHLHLFRSGYGRFTQRPFPFPGMSDVQAYERVRETHEIEAGLVVCYESDGIDPSNNAYVRDLAASRPWIHSVAYLHPMSMPGASHVASLFSTGHCGVTLYLPDEESAKAVDEWPPETWRLLSDARAIVSLNARPEATLYLQRLVERASGCQFLFSHLGLPGRFDTMPTANEAPRRIAALLKLAAFPNVAVKLSGLYAIDPVPPHLTARPFVELLLERFTPTNLHWGSDFSPSLDYVAFEETLELPFLSTLAPTERAFILGASLAAKLKNVRPERATWSAP
jgi:L-fuconolactonase